jgi:myosin heavy subunit
MKALELGNEAIKILRVMSALLHIGNVEFSAEADDSEAQFRSDPSVECACTLLGISRTSLEDLFCRRRMEVSGFIF